VIILIAFLNTADRKPPSV